LKYSGVGSIRKYLEICLREKGKPYIFIHSILLGCSGYRRKLPLVDGNTTKGLTERLLGTPALKFKGSGFHCTDYTRHGRKKM
jgi:hypothetical protein